MTEADLQQGYFHLATEKPKTEMSDSCFSSYSITV
jgi:hypothetical protein